jgi:hypothetical protein
MGAERRLRRRVLRVRALRFDLGNGERLKLDKLVGRGREKDVYRIAGRQEVIGINKLQQSNIVMEVRNEEILRSMEIDSVRTLRYDPQGRWIIKEYIPEPTVSDLLRSGSNVVFQEPLVLALTALLEKLRRAGMWMDMGPNNWVLRFRGDTPYLLNLEAPGLEPVREGAPRFENVFLPMWVGYPIPILMSAGQEQELRKQWRKADEFVFWRKHFGETLPEPDREWDTGDGLAEPS